MPTYVETTDPHEDRAYKKCRQIHYDHQVHKHPKQDVFNKDAFLELYLEIHA
jgi:hypothetical protein